MKMVIRPIFHNINIVLYSFFIKRAFLHEISIDISNQYKFDNRIPAPLQNSSNFRQ